LRFARVHVFGRGLAVPPRLALHQDELDVVLDDGVRLVRFAKELDSVLHLIVGIRDLVPDDGIEVVEANPAA
jgi:hypothetical protein